MDFTTNRIARRFASKIRKAYCPQKIILFGSRARGDHFKTSDFDFIIVSSKLRTIPFFERLSSMYDFWNESVDIEAICYTPEEFSRKAKQRGIIRKAVSEGIEL